MMKRTLIFGVVGGVVLGIALSAVVFYLLRSDGHRPQPPPPTPASVPDLRTGKLANNVGAIGLAPSIYENTFVFFTEESSVGQDLNGDGDLVDKILRLYDVDSGRLSTINLAGVEPVLYQRKLVFHTNENEVKQDLNQDGDTKDIVIRVYDLESRSVVKTLTGGFPSVDGDRIAFHVHERWVDKDLNGDGDQEDMVIQSYDFRTDTLTNTGVDGVRASISGDTIAFTTYEFLVEQDLNNDGDAVDPVIRFYNLKDGTLTNPKTIGEYPDLKGHVVVFEANEATLGADLNQDGDRMDDVVRYYDLQTRRLSHESLSGAFASFNGQTIAYSVQEAQVGRDLNDDGDTEDAVIQLYNIDTQTLTETGIAGTSPAIYNDTVVFYTHESWVNLDLNQDNLVLDFVIQYYRINT